jgi:predicted RNase H-like nuclease (RuvC/YqgF family)
MTKPNLAKELEQEFAQGNFKPSQLKRSKSLSDIPSAPPLPNLKKSKSSENIVSESTSQTELKSQFSSLQEKLKAQEQTNSQLQDQILQLRLKNLQDFSEYYAEKKALEGELAANVNYGLKEIESLEKKLLTLNRKKLTLQEQLNRAEWQNTRWELKAIDREQVEPSQNQPTDNHLIYLALCGTVIFLVSFWLIRKK